MLLVVRLGFLGANLSVCPPFRKWGDTANHDFWSCIRPYYSIPNHRLDYLHYYSFSSHRTWHIPWMLDREHFVALCTLLLRLHHLFGVQVSTFPKKHPGIFKDRDTYSVFYSLGLIFPLYLTAVCISYASSNNSLFAPQVILYPLTGLVFVYFLSIIMQWNFTRGIVNFYHFRVN